MSHYPRTLKWAGAIAELAIFAAALTFLLTNSPEALIVWVVFASLYLGVGFFAVRKGLPLHSTELHSLRSLRSWAWIPPVLAAAIGAMSAVTALIAKSTHADTTDGTGILVAASLGVILSWMLLQVGFAQIYLILDTTSTEEDLRFPEGATRSILNYLYFSFTLGTSFSTSDVEIISTRIRRVALLHTVLAFFYNALVVAVAFQVLQSAVVR